MLIDPMSVANTGRPYASGKQDPYVVVKVGNTEWRSTTVKNTKHATWTDETAELKNLVRATLVRTGTKGFRSDARSFPPFGSKFNLLHCRIFFTLLPLARATTR